MKIFVLIIAFASLAQSNRLKDNNRKNLAKRAILGHGHVETVQNSITNPNKNAYLPPPIQDYPVDQSQISQQSAILNHGIELPATNYLPPFETSQTHNHGIHNGFIPVTNALGSSTSQEHASQYRAAGYLPPYQDHERGHQSSYQPQQPSNYGTPDYLPPLATQPSGHGTVSQGAVPVSNTELAYVPPDNHHHHHHHGEISNTPYNAPGYLPPIQAHENRVLGETNQLSEGSTSAAINLAPHQAQSNHASYNAPGYLPPVSQHEIHESQANHLSEGSTNAARNLQPHQGSYTNPTHQVSQSSHGSYNAPGFLPPVSPQLVTALVPPHVDFEQPGHDAYKAAGYLPPVSGRSNHDQVNSFSAHHGQSATVPHTVYGTPKPHSHSSIYVSPSVNTAAVTLGSQYVPSNVNPQESHYSHQQHGNDHHHHQSQIQHHQQTYNAGQQSYSAQTQAYAPNYEATYAQSSTGVPVPHDYSAPAPMYSQNPTTQYAAEAPIYQTNNGYLPPHTDLLPPNPHHYNHHIQNLDPVYHTPSTVHTNNGYLPPIGSDHISGANSGNDIHFSSNQIQNTGSHSSDQQYASTFPSYSSNHDGYDYSKPKGASFEDGHSKINQNYHSHQNTIIPGEVQPDLHVINTGSEGGHHQVIKIIRIIDETVHGAIPNIRTLKIIKETRPGEPSHSSIQTIRIISEPSTSSQSHISSTPHQTEVSPPELSNHQLSVAQPAEHHVNLQAQRSESAGENVEGGYLPPPDVLQPPVIQQPVITPPVSQTIITPPVPHSHNEHHLHVPHHQQVSEVHHQHAPPPPIHHSHQAAIHNQIIPPVPDIRPPTTVPGYLPPIQAQHPNSNVKILRILHDSNFNQQQDAIFAGVAEQNNNDINTIRVIHQQEAATSGRYGYPSPQINSVKLLRYYRRY